MKLTKKNFQKLDKIHLSLENRHSMSAIIDILSESYIEITQSGVVKDYTYYKSLTTLGDSSLEIIEYDIKILDETKVLSYYKLKNLSKNSYTMRSNIWIFENNSWKLTFHQGTKIV
ncbi:hypothetical protein AJL11_01900 [Listeria monocytogenes]|uniref:DUF4440 domain-containing protein n=1 Tax=Listeria monocytogenes TaxID=1639 RepID=A0A823JDR4_LISMN|nr:hypothetical protein [Listeria monocytogenes]EAG9222788.1 hypothetical protein [Listeria monocytogenes]EAG9290612.1 hypothetical protein [Listeria monocytogenes]EAG9354688.1 hypothetical protein [Listeria monocytogenes]OET20459.1 hypothetical protein AJL11_01900 [Listeria monocytogenes]OFG90820.1 hypothetical protein BJM83_13335 [Listeria monocytogenes]